MANQKAIIELLYSVKESIKLEITEYEWAKDYKLNFFDFAASFEYKGQKFIGRGADKSELLAIEKASAEAVERLICYVNKIDSVGLSVGLDYNCDGHAKFEVLERFYLNEHLAKKIKFAKHNVYYSDLLNEFQTNNSDVKVEFLKMATPKDYFGFVCLIKQGQSRSLGFSYSDQEQIALDKSFIEALPNLAWLRNNDVKTVEKPWHLKDEFIDEVEPLISNDIDSVTFSINPPVLEKVDLNLKSISFLADFKIKVSKYQIKTGSE